MFQFLGDVIGGAGKLAGGIAGAGWDTVTGLGSSIVGAGQGVLGGFFPPQQKIPIVSDIAEPLYETGLDFRVTDPDAPSWHETAMWAQNDWLGTTYEEDLSAAAKIRESQLLEQSVSAVKQPGLSGMLADMLSFGKGMLGEAKEFKTLADEFTGILGLRKPVSEGPREVGNSRGAVQYTNQEQPGGPNLITVAKGLLGGFTEQVKGLFNTGFAQQRTQPAFAIKHELEPTKKTMLLGVGLAGALLAGMFLLRKK